MSFDEDVRDRLLDAFADARVVFWEDEKGEFADSIGGLSLDGVSVVVVANDEFAVKRRVLREQAEGRFLIYRAGGAPDRLLDYLYDIKLASKRFVCSQAAVWAQECGLPDEAIDTLSAHAAFFENKQRRGVLASICSDAEWMAGVFSPRGLELSLIAACCGERSTRKIDVVRGIGKAVLRAYVGDSDVFQRLVDRCDLAGALWRVLREGFGYVSDQSGYEDFALEVVDSSCSALTGRAPSLNVEGELLLDSLSRDSTEAATFEGLIERTGPYMEGRCDLAGSDHAVVIGNRYLKGIDAWLIAGYAEEITQGIDCSDDLTATVGVRSGTHWFAWASDSYQALEAASVLVASCKTFETQVDSVSSADECFERYVGEWSEIDSAYRRFSYWRRSAEIGDFSALTEKIEPLYGRFLSGLARRWQEFSLAERRWPPDDARPLQRDFFNTYVESQPGRCAVIISDALRYEAAGDLASRLGTSATRDVKLDAVLSTVPSYTQLGMAALLPNERLTFDTGSQHALVDGRDATGMNARAAVLDAVVTDARVARAGDLLDAGDASALADARLVYVYHNRIDAVGDKRDSEKEVFAAVEETYRQIERLVDMLLKTGFDRVVVTSDHGFIYQNGDPSTFEYANVDLLDTIASGDDANRTRRFVAAKDIPGYDDIMVFVSGDLGLEGDFKVGIPKGIRRFRLKGSGARFVHGGLTLQETVVPVLTVKTKKRAHRKSSVTSVGVDVLTGGKRVISWAQIAFELLQTEPVSDERLPLHVRVGLYDEGGQAVSQVMEVNLNSAVPDAGSRKTPLHLLVPPSVGSGARLTLRVDGRYGNTNKYTEDVASQTYTVRRNFGMDF